MCGISFGLRAVFCWIVSFYGHDLARAILLSFSVYNVLPFVLVLRQESLFRGNRNMSLAICVAEGSWCGLAAMML
eukprot:1368310-Amorphochlora_amoeboformis.AAC.1